MPWCSRSARPSRRLVQVAVPQVDTVVFDKTGTLTEGRPVVCDVAVANGAPNNLDARALLAAAAAVEEGTTHPIGRAIVSAWDARGARTDRAEPGTSEQVRRPSSALFIASVECSNCAVWGGGSSTVYGANAARCQSARLAPCHSALPHSILRCDSDAECRSAIMQEPGSGISAVVGGLHVSVGTLDWLQRSGSSGQNGAGNGAAPPAGLTRVYVAIDGRTVGHIDLRDAARPGAAATVAQLQDRGIRCVPARCLLASTLASAQA